MELNPVELWGGLECTIARTRHGFRNLVAETGHLDRPGDLEAIAALGIETLRYPVLFEAVAPDHPDHCDWAWADQRLATIRRLGVRPIVGLLHHGSGPAYTSLLDPQMPSLLARHAAKVAARYPWVDRYTPVNEPLTTARFSALYGHWYPHAEDLRSCLHAVVIQCKAIVLAMRAVRQVNPAAQLVQTEDIGKTFSTPNLRSQADHENLRRWLSLDLLCGTVHKAHPWHGYLLQHGILEQDLDLFLAGDAGPDIIGINHYLTSERYLDELIGNYPADLWGGNGRQVYADADAVRVDMPAHDRGLGARLEEVWTRYRRPIAVTEAHNGSSRDEQLRWLVEAWEAAEAVRQRGVDIRAVTVWALFGSLDWDSLLTERRGSYEPGAFDVRAPEPRLTAVGYAASALAATGRFDHPVLDGKGWWHRAGRFYGDRHLVEEQGSEARSLLIVGDGGTLSQALIRICDIRGLCFNVMPLDLVCKQDCDDLAEMLLGQRSWAAIDATSLPTVEVSVRPARAAPSSSSLAKACASLELPIVAFSSALVFDGRLGRAYDEADEPIPVGPAGRSALQRERNVLACNARSLVIRSGPIFSAWGDESSANRVRSVAVSPTYAPDLAHAVLDLLIDGERGLWHLCNQGLADLASFSASLTGAAVTFETPLARDDAPVLNFALTSRRGWMMPRLDDALNRFRHDAELERMSDLMIAAE